MLDAIRAYLGEHPLIDELGPTGRQRSRQAYQRRFATALAWAAAVHLSALAADQWTQRTGEEAGPAPKPPRIIHLDSFIPPSISAVVAPEPPRFTPKMERPTAPPIGDAVPVPAIEAEARTIRTPLQNLMRDALPDTGLGDTGGYGGDPFGNGDGPVIVIDDPEDERPDPDSIKVVEKEPRLVEGPAPVYPDLARQAQIEGTVVVRALVGKDGKVKEVLLVRSAHDLLDRAALEATRGYAFTPAIQNGRPVAVWVSIPFRFRLR
jgi:protein TonB